MTGNTSFLMMSHHLFPMTFDGKLGLAPPNDQNSDIKHVLDLGTETGVWAIDYAEEHPAAKVTGIDLSPSQPSLDAVPPNEEFLVDDIDEEHWTWPEYLRKVFENLTPSGYVELQETDLFVRSDDGTFKEGQPLYRCLQLLHDASVKFGRAYQDIEKLKDVMAKVIAFLVDVRKDLMDTSVHAYWLVYSIYGRKPVA
ncbi:hypothetical protein NKR23_g11363 [Pleurostoma richardsiae]|uniref:Methyltransferase domain-containing protein n=1 Tax=Pleurostoma richardsiae TaxID=41990 RepID=A0AA38RAT6_9PEZI|nr:hypothetical protein NKR23_g11363 [Pleurostoma richardsiae]